MGAFVEGMILREDTYDKYKSKEEDDDSDEGEIEAYVNCEADKTEDLQKSANISLAVASGVYLARDLGNAPPNDLYPMAFAEQAIAFGNEHDNVKVSIINYEQAISMGMGGLVGVGMGSLENHAWLSLKSTQICQDQVLVSSEKELLLTLVVSL